MELRPHGLGLELVSCSSCFAPHRVGDRDNDVNIFLSEPTPCTTGLDEDVDAGPPIVEDKTVGARPPAQKRRNAPEAKIMFPPATELVEKLGARGNDSRPAKSSSQPHSHADELVLFLFVLASK